MGWIGLQLDIAPLCYRQCHRYRELTIPSLCFGGWITTQLENLGRAISDTPPEPTRAGRHCHQRFFRHGRFRGSCWFHQSTILKASGFLIIISLLLALCALWYWFQPYCKLSRPKFLLNQTNHKNERNLFFTSSMLLLMLDPVSRNFKKPWMPVRLAQCLMPLVWNRRKWMPLSRYSTPKSCCASEKSRCHAEVWRKRSKQSSPSCLRPM